MFTHLKLRVPTAELRGVRGTPERRDARRRHDVSGELNLMNPHNAPSTALSALLLPPFVRLMRPPRRKLP